MPDYLKTPEVKFYVIKSNLTYEESNNPKALAKSDDIAILKITTIHISWKGQYGESRGDSTQELEILDSKLEPIDEFEKNGWKFRIAHLVGSGWHNNKHRFKANFVDFLEIENKIEDFGIDPTGFISAYKRFLKLSEYKGYKNAVIQIENENLQGTVTSLKEEIVGLKGEIARLTEKLSFIRITARIINRG
jgi:hypothetical protein